MSSVAVTSSGPDTPATTEVTASPTEPAWQRHARRMAPVACACAAVGVGAALVFVDPTDRSVLPPCPLHSATGLWCPGCGMTRATHALIHGDVARALSFNLFAPVILAIVAVSWWSWLRTSWDRPAPRWTQNVPRSAWITGIAAIVVFTVARNLAPFDTLAP